jgi:hypothetical protein
MTLRRSIAISILVGSGAWLAFWFSADERANWDSLMYHTYALEYAGLPTPEAEALSWDLFARYTSDGQLARVEAVQDGQPWVTPVNERWTNLYRMRPAYPALVAAAYPALGLRAPMAVSALVTIGFVVVSFTGLGLVFGYQVSTLATAVALLNGFFAHWLIFLSTDGLAILLWSAVLLAIARFAQTGRSPWLFGLAAAVLLLGVTRPTSSLAPLVPAACAVVAIIVRNPIWRRFGLATMAAGIPAVGVLLGMHLLGMPGLYDVLQENPTRHFSQPDVADPLNWLARQIQWAVPYRLLPTLLGEHVLFAAVAAGLAGLVVGRSWIVAPFLAAAVIAPIAWLMHPIWSDANRILSPTWVSLNVGVALLGVTLLRVHGGRALAAVEWATRAAVPDPRPAAGEIPAPEPQIRPIPVISGPPRRLGWEPRAASERLAEASRKMEA